MTSTDNQFFLRDAPYNGLDAITFHYSVHRAFQRFLGMDGNLQVAYDVSVNFVSAWNQTFVENDFINAYIGKIDPRHMHGTSNFDVFRWNSLNNGTQKSVLGTFIATLLMPGIPLVRVPSRLLWRISWPHPQLYYGEEQNIYLYDNTANNYLFGYALMT